MSVVRFEEIRDVIVVLRDQSVIIDRDVAEIYGVETKRINEAVKNNPDKFPPDYMFELTNQEFDVLRSKFSTTKFAKTRATPKAFTEKGLYMIATILTGRKAVEAAFGIIETFAKIRELSRTVKVLSAVCASGPARYREKAGGDTDGSLWKRRGGHLRRRRRIGRGGGYWSSHCTSCA